MLPSFRIRPFGRVESVFDLIILITFENKVEENVKCAGHREALLNPSLGEFKGHLESPSRILRNIS